MIYLFNEAFNTFYFTTICRRLLKEKTAWPILLISKISFICTIPRTPQYILRYSLQQLGTTGWNDK